MSTTARAAVSATSDPAEFGAAYRENVGAITSFFARRCSEPQVVADLTSETFVEAVAGFASFELGRGSVRAWLFGIARHVYADYCAAVADANQAGERFTAQMILDEDEIEQLVSRIDDQEVGRRLLQRCARLPELDRAAIELVDLSDLSYREAGCILQVSPGALRVRVFRARARLRKGAERS